MPSGLPPSRYIEFCFMSANDHQNTLQPARDTALLETQQYPNFAWYAAVEVRGTDDLGSCIGSRASAPACALHALAPSLHSHKHDSILVRQITLIS